MGEYDKDDLKLDLAAYYATRGKLTHLDEAVTGAYPDYTALTWACEEGYLEIVKCLLAAGADKDKAASYEDHTPFMSAVMRDNVETVQLLLDAGADKDKTDLDGRTALSYATSKGYEEIVQLLQPGGPQQI